MWLDRLTGERLDNLPEFIESGRYLVAKSRSAHPGPSYETLSSSGLLVDGGSELCPINGERHVFVLPPKSLAQKVELFRRVLETIDAGNDEPGELISPLMPEGVINEDRHLNTFDLSLLKIIGAGHLHQISMRPRTDVRYEDEVTDVARAKKLAKGALVHLASHAECWQRQTLSGVIPKRVKGRFSEDDFNIYENRVYARLLDKIEQYLTWRVGTLRQLHSAVSEALEFYGTTGLHYRLTDEICRLWGKTFSQDSTSKASEQLTETLNHLEWALGIIRSLKQRGLYRLVSRSAQMGSGLHLTNILTHDQHYCRLPVLWNELKSIAGGKWTTPDEQREHNDLLNRAYSRYAGLVLRLALLPYLGKNLTSAWAGSNLYLRQVGLDWQLRLSSAGVDQSDRVVLELVPWMGFVNRPKDVSSQENDGDSLLRILAWPNLGEDRFSSEEVPYDGTWVPLSPFDLYGVERVGYLVDQQLSRELVSRYGRALKKVPSKCLDVAAQMPELEVNEVNYQIKVLDEMSPENLAKMYRSLVDENASEQASQLNRRHQEIMELKKCPVCSCSVTVAYQKPDGFISDCLYCKTKRYLRRDETGREYEQSLAGLTEFGLVGRRSFLCKL